jgi:DNA-binding response OmpR family regulator
LALTKELVDLHHGVIVVESEVRSGSTFFVRLPLGKEHLQPEEVVSDQLSVSSSHLAKFKDRESKIEDRASSIRDQVETERKSRRFGTTSDQQLASSNKEPATSDEAIILVIEDNRDVRAYIRQYLEPAFKVIEAVDGVDGVAQALETIPDLILCDVMMPKRDGNEVCHILRTDEKTSHIPIMMLTAKADCDSKVQGLETGADDYLIKPFDSRELLARVHNLIKLRQQLRERFSRELVLQPSAIAVTPQDEVFLNKVNAVVEKHMGDEDFDVDTFSRELGMSRVHLHRKLKALTDQSASQLIRMLRLQRAADLLKQDAGTIAEIAYQVGFSSQAYFTKCFHEHFGHSPKEHVEKNS